MDASTAAPAVAFDDVTFRYETRERAAVDDVSFTAQPGQTLAIVGHSGAGKSTIVALLLRFFDPDRGRITIDGTDIRDVTLDSLREQVAVVSQDTYLFYGSVADNLRLASPEATDEELVDATRRPWCLTRPPPASTPRTSARSPTRWTGWPPAGPPW